MSSVRISSHLISPVSEPPFAAARGETYGRQAGARAHAGSFTGMTPIQAPPFTDVPIPPPWA